MESIIVKKYLNLSAVIYLIFVIYGSLVPLEFSYIDINQALSRFRQIPFLNLGIESRADWVANFLLFIPLTYLWMCYFDKQENPNPPLILAIAITSSSLLLSIGIEFTQLYFPQRTVSQNDILAESIGGITGVILWLKFHNKILNKLNTALAGTEQANKLAKLLIIYVAILILYSVMPLDLTISPIEIYHKWNEGRIILIPFSKLPLNLWLSAYEILSDTALWVPIPILAYYSNFKSDSIASLYKKIIILSILIEVSQVFIYSRVTDLTDIITAIIGTALGILILKKTIKWSNKTKYAVNKTEYAVNKTHIEMNQKTIGILAYVTWLIVMCFIFWYPFSIKTNSEYVNQGISGFFSIPFVDYYYGSEFRALTEVFHKYIFAFPLGLFLAITLLTSGTLSKKIKDYISYIIIIFSCIIIEITQIIIEEKYSSITDAIIMITGGVTGYKAFNYVKNAKELTNKNSKNSEKKENANTPKIDITIKYIPIGLLILYSLIIAVNKSLALPYNIQELLTGNNIYIHSMGVSLIILWCFGFPLGIQILRARKLRLRAKTILIYFVIHAMVSWILVRAILPLESIHDIIGYPVWKSFIELEMLFRFFALFSLYSFNLFLISSIAVKKLKISNMLIRHAALTTFYLFIVLPIAFTVIVVFAGTDNITELLPNNGYSLYIIAIIGYISLLNLSAISLSTWRYLPSNSLKIKSILFITFSVPVSYWLLKVGTEHTIIKYDQVFSTLQFLLSGSRSNYVTGSDLILRFVIAHTALICIIAFSQYHIWSRFSKNSHCNTTDVEKINLR